MYGCNIFESTDGSGWAHHINDCPTDNYSCGYYVRLLQDSTFNNELRCRYETRQRFQTLQTFLIIWMSVETLVQNAQARQTLKMAVVARQWSNTEVGAIATTYNAEIDAQNG